MRKGTVGMRGPVGLTMILKSNMILAAAEKTHCASASLFPRV